MNPYDPQDDEDTPRSRRRQRQYDEDDYDDAPADKRKRAIQKLNTFAFVQRLITIIYLFIDCTLLVIFIIRLNTQALAPMELNDFIVYTVVCSAALLLLITNFVGTVCMNSHRHFWLALTSVILSTIAPLCMSCFGFLILGIGIWGIVVLADSNVRQLFWDNNYNPHMDDYDDTPSDHYRGDSANEPHNPAG